MKEIKILSEINNKYVDNIINDIPKEILNRCSIVKYKKDELICIKGSNVEDIHINCNGEIYVITEFENGFTYKFASINSRAYIGVMEIMANKSNYISSLKCSSDCIMIKIPKDVFTYWVNIDHKLSIELLKFMSNIMCEQSKGKGDALVYPSIYIVGKYISDSFKEQSKDILLIDKNREDIASYLGFSVRTINRSLKSLKEEDLIRVSRKGIRIDKDNILLLDEKLEEIKSNM